MEKKRILTAVLIAVILIFIILAGLYFYSFSKIEFADIRVNKLGQMNLSGFTLEGDIDIQNKGIFPVKIDRIEYEVIVSSGEKLTEGYIEGGRIPVNQITTFGFSNRIDWAPTADFALSLLGSRDSYATIKGEVYVADLYITEIKIPFEEKIDLKDFLGQFAGEILAGSLGNVIKGVFGQVA